MNPIQEKSRQFDILILLRSIAVISVVLCHYCGVLEIGHNLSFLFKGLHNYGKYGVHIFFVISGFVIPYSLMKGGYKGKNYIEFVIKRIIRLHPPYLASLVITVGLAYIFHRYLYNPFTETIQSFTLSTFYLHTSIDNPVYWTLIIEAQYYLFIGFFYILITKYKFISYTMVIPILLYVCQTRICDYVSLFLFLPFFLLGNIVVVLYYEREKNDINILMLFALLVYIAQYYALPALIVSSITIFCILFIRGTIPDFYKFIGTISYSIYLIHYPIGMNPLIYFRSIVNPEYYWILIIVSLCIVIIFSWIFYLIFEKKSERISKSIRYS